MTLATTPGVFSKFFFRFFINFVRGFGWSPIREFFFWGTYFRGWKLLETTIFIIISLEGGHFWKSPNSLRIVIWIMPIMYYFFQISPLNPSVKKKSISKPWKIYNTITWKLQIKIQKTWIYGASTLIMHEFLSILLTQYNDWKL